MDAAAAFVRELVGDDLTETGFLAALDVLAGHPPSYRTALIAHFASLAGPTGRDSEHGVDGSFVHAGVEVWNAYEFAPWQFTRPATVVFGDLVLGWDSNERRHAAAEIHPGARVFVTGATRVGTLHVLGGELHCTAELEVPVRLVVASGAHVAASSIRAGEYGGWGDVACAAVHHHSVLGSEAEAIAARPTNASIIAAMTRTRR